MKKIIKTTTTYEYDSEGRVIKEIIEEVTEDVYDNNQFYRHYPDTLYPVSPVTYPTYIDYITCTTTSDVNKYQE